MDTATLLLVLAIAGVNFGWQPAENGAAGYEYIVQVEPELLDALQRGEALPIESNVPPEVAPIRKVRIVVGRDQLPRSPLHHTANFADPPGWSPDRYSAAPAGNTNYDRYTAPAGTTAAGVGPPPTLLDRAGTAAGETARTLDRGIQTGAQSASQQLQQWTADATSQLPAAGNNLRAATAQTFGTTSNQLRRTENPLAQTGGNSVTRGNSGVSAPPWPTATSNSSTQVWPVDAAASQTLPIDYAPTTSITQTATGWTSIGSNVAAPPLLNPPLATSPASNPGLRVAATNPGGPVFPAETTDSREPLHSVLVDPDEQSAAAGASANDWARGWGPNGTTSQPTIGRAANVSATSDAQNSVGTISARPPAVPTAQDTRQAADRWGDPWTQTDPWPAQPQGSPQVNPPPQDSGAFTNNGHPTSARAQSAIGPAAVPANTAGFGANPNLQPGNSAGPQQAANHLANQGRPLAEQPPWLPLLIVSLSLVGSLSANLFLGWSYIDARQKYRTLVRKTADTFRRVAGAAAA